MERAAVDDFMRQMIASARKNTECKRCGYRNGTVKKNTGAIKIIHERDDFYDSIPNLAPPGSSVYQEDLNPLSVQMLFEKMTPEDIELLNMSDSISHPKNMLMTYVPVPPVCIRPSVQVSQGMTNEDDLTVKLQEVIQLNNVIKSQMEKGSPLSKVMQDWEYVQGTLAQYINSDVTGLP